MSITCDVTPLHFYKAQQQSPGERPSTLGHTWRDVCLRQPWKSNVGLGRGFSFMKGYPRNYLHSGSRVKLLTLAAAAKQPSIFPPPDTWNNNERSVLKLVSPWPHLVGCLCRTFAGQDCKQRGGRGLHLCQHQHPLWLRPSACRSLKCLQTSKWTFDLEHALPSSNRSSPKSLLRHSCTSKSPLPWVSSLHLSIDLGQVSSRMGSAATRGAASSISPITSLWQLVDSCASFWITFSFRHSITLPSKKFPPPSLSTRFFPAMRFPQNLGISCK